MRRIVPGLVAALALVAVGVLLTLSPHPRTSASAAGRPTPGEAFDQRGRAVDQARVSVVGSGDEAALDALRLTRPQLVRVQAPGYLPRVVALAPGQDWRANLTPQTPSAVSIRFGGDLMMGRRFYENGPESGPLISRPTGTLAEHRALMRRIEPLLGDADLGVVNLETPLVNDPYFGKKRPRRFHQGKELAFASAPITAEAIAQAGVDVVSLGNNHVYDARGPGLAETRRALDRAGIASFGAGETVEEAWKPAVVRVRGERVAFVGCTTVTGAQYPTAYVAGPDQGGAAECETDRLRKAVTRARAQADTVVFMMHGGVEYRPRPTDWGREITRTAVEAGASAVVNSHPHVLGGVSATEGVPVVESSANLVFDQQLWDTLPSALFRIDFDAGRAVSTALDPLAIDDFVPTPVTGAPAEAIRRLTGTGSDRTTEEADPEDLLLGTGGLEEYRTTDGDDPLFWTLGRYARLTGEAACTGERGVSMVRSPVSQEDVTLSADHRIPVRPGQRLTLRASVSQASAGGAMELRGYRSMEGASDRVLQRTIPEQAPGGGCRTVDLAVTVPPGTRAVQPYLRLTPPRSANLAAELGVDDVRLLSPAAGPARRR